MAAPRTKIGVLALQGAYRLHKPHIEALSAQYVEVISKSDFGTIDGIILPGGESGTMLKLIETLGIEEVLRGFLQSKPTWGICAGAILMARTVLNPAQKSFGAIDIELERNAYGRQLDSAEEVIDHYLVSYIRAPKITGCGAEVKVAKRRDGKPTWVEHDRKMVTTFHPETNLKAPSPWHQRFMEYCRMS